MQPQGQLAITPQQRTRLAVVYIHTAAMPTSPIDHVHLTVQRDQVQQALAWGWPESVIHVIEDLGKSGGSERPGWHRLLALVRQEQVGVILTTDASRLSRSATDFQTLLDLCERTQTLLTINGEEFRLDRADAFLRMHSADVRAAARHRARRIL